MPGQDKSFIRLDGENAHFRNLFRQAIVFAVSLVFLVTLLIYTTALRNEFVNWDDPQCVYQNRHIRSLDGTSLYWMITSFHEGNWHPLTWFSHALVYYLWELNPTMHHLANILLHALNASLVFFVIICLLKRINAPPQRVDDSSGISTSTQGLITAGVAALLFVLHPLNVESVAWVTERKGLLSSFFMLLSLLSYLSYASSIHKKNLAWYYVSLLLFVLALMSKPIAVTLPITFLLLDIYPLKRTSHYLNDNLIVFLEKIPFFFFSIASGIITIMAQSSSGALWGFYEIHPANRILHALVTIVFYLEKLIWPFKLIPFYPFTENLPNLRIVSSGITILVISGFSIVMARRHKPLWLIAWLYYVITLLPTLGIIQIGGHAAADRFTYLPKLSITILAGAAVAWLWRRVVLSKSKELVRGVLISCVFLVMIFFSHRTMQQIRIWENSVVLWRYVIDALPHRVPLAHNNLGLAYNDKGMLDEAISEYIKALTLKTSLPDVHNNLSIAYYYKGYYKLAIVHCDKAIELGFEVHPQFLRALRSYR